MEAEHQPFPGGRQEIDFDRARKVGTLLAPRGNNSGDKQTQCRDTAWSPDGKLFAWSCGRRTIKIVSVEDIQHSLQPKDCMTIDCRQTVTALEFINLDRCRGCLQMSSGYHMLQWHEYSQVLAVGLRNGRIRIIDVNTGSILLELLDHTDQVSHLHFLPNQSLTLCSSSFDGTVKLWDLADDGNMAASLRPADALSCRNVKHKVYCIASSPDTLRVATVGTFKTVVIFDMRSGKVSQKLSGHVNRVNSCEFGPDGVLLVTASSDTTAIVWNSWSGQILAKLGHQFPPPPEWFPGEDDTNVLHCRFSSNSIEVVTVADDGLLRLWDLNEPNAPSAIYAVEDPLCCSFNTTGGLVAIGTAIGDVEIVTGIRATISLAQMCRIVINNCMNLSTPSAAGISENSFETVIGHLRIPQSLKRFLKYEHTST